MIDEVPYAEGVTFHSPGSRGGAAGKRTLGTGSMTTSYTLKGFHNGHRFVQPFQG